jgi:glycosyltransferase involved in cell wall biosynthesis
MRRILLLLTDLEIGGTPTVVRELAIRLHRAGAHVEVVGLSPPGPLREQLLAAGVKCRALGGRGMIDAPRTLWRLLRLMRQERIDTVVSFLIHANAMAAAARIFYLRARYCQSIQTTQPTPRWHWSLQRLVQGAAKQFIVPSPSVAVMARRCGVSNDRILVIPNAVELAEFSGTGGPPVNHGRDTHTTSVGFIGRLDPIKRIPNLIAAIQMVPNSVLHIYGEGAQRPQIESQISGLTGYVTLHGAIARPQDVLKLIDILVLPSDAEGFGLVLIEAMSAGVPVIATNVPGIRDVVTHEQTGLLVPPRNPAAIAAAIKRLQEDGQLRARLIANGRAHVERHYTWQSIFPQYARLLLD